MVHFDVADLAAIEAVLRPEEVLVPRRSTPYGAQEVFATDPAGNVLGFAEMQQASDNEPTCEDPVSQDNGPGSGEAERSTRRIRAPGPAGESMGRLLWAIGALLAVGLPVAGWIGIYVHHGSLGLGSLTALAGAAAVGWWGSGPGRTRTLGWALLGLGGVAWGAVGWAGWQWRLHEQALRNLETMKAHWRALAAYREAEGAYPEDLAAALDRSPLPEGLSGPASISWTVFVV